MKSSRPPLVTAMRWVSEITNISLLQIIPVIGGWALDQWLRTQFVFIALGAVMGMYVSMKRILEIAGASNKPPGSPESREPKG